MLVYDNTLENLNINYPIDSIAPLDDILYIDIETTGFAARTSNLYLIGLLYHKEDAWHTKQFFSETYTDEKELIEEFFDFSKDFTHLVHYNGNNFDIPYIIAKCKEHNINENFDRFEGIDIYKRLSPYKTFLKLENCKQKTVEHFLGIEREDKFSGGDLIGIYHSYVKNKDDGLREILLLHNFDDIKGMLALTPVLAYSDMFSKKLKVTKVSANYYVDEAGNNASEVLMAFDLPNPLPVTVSFLYDRCYFAGGGNQGMIKVPLYEEEMKYFYYNYKDYYYLPDEDTAIHKSVASFVDKDHRERATKENCYTRQFAKYLPEWSDEFTPFFKRSYESKELFFELTDERRTDRALFSAYASHVLNHMTTL